MGKLVSDLLDLQARCENEIRWCELKRFKHKGSKRLTRQMPHCCRWNWLWAFLVTWFGARCRISQNQSAPKHHFLISHSPIDSLQSAFWPLLFSEIVFSKLTGDILITKFHTYFSLVFILKLPEAMMPLLHETSLYLGGSVLYRLPFWCP